MNLPDHVRYRLRLEDVSTGATSREDFDTEEERIQDLADSRADMDREEMMLGED